MKRKISFHATTFGLSCFSAPPHGAICQPAVGNTRAGSGSVDQLLTSR